MLRLEAREDIATAVRGGTLVLSGAILLFYGWIIVVAWVVYIMGRAASRHNAWCHGRVPRHCGAVLGWFGAGIFRGIRLMRPDDPEADRREQQALKAAGRA